MQQCGEQGGNHILFLHQAQKKLSCNRTKAFTMATVGFILNLPKHSSCESLVNFPGAPQTALFCLSLQDLSGPGSLRLQASFKIPDGVQMNMFCLCVFPHKMFWTQGLHLLPIVHRIQHTVDALNPVSSQDSDKDSVFPGQSWGLGSTDFSV